MDRRKNQLDDKGKAHLVGQPSLDENWHEDWPVRCGMASCFACIGANRSTKSDERLRDDKDRGLAETRFRSWIQCQQVSLSVKLVCSTLRANAGVKTHDWSTSNLLDPLLLLGSMGQFCAPVFHFANYPCLDGAIVVLGDELTLGKGALGCHCRCFHITALASDAHSLSSASKPA